MLLLPVVEHPISGVGNQTSILAKLRMYNNHVRVKHHSCVPAYTADPPSQPEEVKDVAGKPANFTAGSDISDLAALNVGEFKCLSPYICVCQ